MGFPLAIFWCALGCSYIAGISGELELHFYKNSCPNAEMIVKEHVISCLLTDPSSAAPLLRLAFHDCQVDVLSLSLSGCVCVSLCVGWWLSDNTRAVLNY